MRGIRRVILMSWLIALATTHHLRGGFGSGGAAATRPVSRVSVVNDGFRAWLDQHRSTPAGDRVMMNDASTADEQNFLESALVVLSAELGQALALYDGGALIEARHALAPLLSTDNPFLSMTAQYYDARIAVAQGMLEEAEELLKTRFADWSSVARFTNKAPHARLLLAHCQAGNLRFDEAMGSLRDLVMESSDAPESVRVGAKQLVLELERRERGTLAEAAGLMDYSQRRLASADATERVQQRQEEIVKLLDELIEDAQQQEQKSKSGGRGGQGGQGRQAGRPGAPLEESRTTPGAGQIGDLHTAPQAQPGEMWGKLPPAEREKILERLREKYPSRYRQLVEQYYRSLAGEN